MRLIGFLPFLLIGIAAGVLIARVRGQSIRPGILVCGVIGAVGGLWVRDVLDIAWGGDLYGGLVVALFGALVLALSFSLVNGAPGR